MLRAVAPGVRKRGAPTRKKPAYGRSTRTVGRALALLNCFTLNTPQLSLQQLSAVLGLHRSTVHRLATHLCEEGYLQHDRSTARYRLGLRLFELGAVVLADLQLHRLSRPHLEDLRNATDESVHLAILDHDEVLYLEKIESSRSLKTSSTLGSRRPAHCTSLGKALLAFRDPAEVRRIVQARGLSRLTPRTITDIRPLLKELQRVRALGYAVDNEETEVGLRCLAAPVRDFSGAVIAAIGISGPSSRLSDAVLPQLAAKVRETAIRISRDMGWGLAAPWPSER